MIKQTLILISFFLLSISSSFSQNVRGFYISDISSWIGKESKEDEILEYAKGNGYNYIALYSLHALNWTGNGHKKKLAKFILKAKTQYDITHVGAVLETYSFMADKILPYNNGRSNPKEKFDVINHEFEFWINASIVNQYAQNYLIPNGYTADSAGAFAFSQKELIKIDSACSSNGLISEVYLGWPNKGQMQKIVSLADRILLHAYRPDDGDVYAYSKNRLKDIASLNMLVKVIPIFSAEPVFMGPWLDSNPKTKPYSSYANDFVAEIAPFKQNIDLQGYQWFTYAFMPKKIEDNAVITADGPLVICPGGSVQLIANEGTSYKWSPGGERTRTITVTSPGTYKVRVKQNTGKSYHSAPTIVSFTNTPTTPTIISSGPVTFCDGGDVTLTSSYASNYIWSNGATTRSITVSSPGQYQVRAENGICSAISQPVTVTTNIPPTPVITSSGALNICQGTNVTLTSSPAGGYLWSNGATTRSIVVSSAGDYYVNGYISGNCSAQSTEKKITIMPAPSRPVISTNGSTILTPSHTSITMTSSYGTSYEWSNGSTNRSISTSTAGLYRVTITGTNGCSATSDPELIQSPTCLPPDEPDIIVNGDPHITDDEGVELTTRSANGYLWSNKETTQSVNVHEPGSYSVRVYTGPDCYSTSMPVTITSVEDGILQPGFPGSDNHSVALKIYPNPASVNITYDFISTEISPAYLFIYDSSGRVLKSEQIPASEGENKFSMDISELPSGIYFGGIEKNGMREIVRLVIRQ